MLAIIGDRHNVTCCWCSFEMIAAQVNRRVGKMTLNRKQVSFAPIKLLCLVYGIQLLDMTLNSLMWHVKFSELKKYCPKTMVLKHGLARISQRPSSNNLNNWGISSNLIEQSAETYPSLQIQVPFVQFPWKLQSFGHNS